MSGKSSIIALLHSLAAMGIDVPLNREVNLVKVERIELPKETLERCEADRIKAADEKRARKAARKAKQS